MNGFDAGFLSIEQATGGYFGKEAAKPNRSESHMTEMSFQDIFLKQTEAKENIKFSKHANARLESRNISLSDEQLGRLSNGVEKAKAKNINESLVMMDNIAFIVNIKNNTVVTAIDKNDENNVFTNIDGAVIV